MFAMGGFEIVILTILFWVLAGVVLYYVVKAAVRNGTYEAHRRLERDRVRWGQGVGDERRPGQAD